MTAESVHQPKCGTCGAELAPNPLAITTKCGYCGTEYAAAHTKRRGSSALASVGTVQAAKKPVEPGSFRGFLWMCIILFLGTVILGWAISKIPYGGIIVLATLGAGVVVVAVGKLFPRVPALFIGLSRLVFQHFSTLLPFFVLLICVGIVAIVFHRGDVAEEARLTAERAAAMQAAAQKRAKAETLAALKQNLADEQAERAAAAFMNDQSGLAEQLDAVDRALERKQTQRARDGLAKIAAILEPLLRSSIADSPDLAAFQNRQDEQRAALGELEIAVYHAYFEVLREGGARPRNRALIDRVVGSRFGLDKQAAADIFRAHQREPYPAASAAGVGEQPGWAQKKAFANKCGVPPDDTAKKAFARTVLAQPGDKLKCTGEQRLNCQLADPESVVFDPNSCSPPKPHRKKCWTVTCIWHSTDAEGLRELHVWEHAFENGTHAGHRVLFPAKR